MEFQEKSREEVLLDNPNEVEGLSIEQFSLMIFHILEEKDFPVLRKIIAKSALRQLSKRQQEVIKMTFWENKSSYEIAKELRISRRSVRVTLDRALVKMRVMLESGEIVEQFKKLTPLIGKTDQLYGANLLQKNL